MVGLTLKTAAQLRRACQCEIFLILFPLRVRIDGQEVPATQRFAKSLNLYLHRVRNTPSRFLGARGDTNASRSSWVQFTTR